MYQTKHSSRKAITPLTKKHAPANRVEALEARIVPARLFAVDDANHLLSFDSATPGNLTLNANITGLSAGEFILGIDVRPATGQLYALGITDDGLTRTGKIYTLNTTTAAATLVGQFSSNLTDTSNWGFDFNPTVDRIRIVERGNDLNLRVNPNNGTLVATDTSITDANIDAVAYDRNEGGTGLTTLYGINFSNDHLVTIGGIDGSPSPNGGTVVDIGAMGVVTSGNLNFDIESGTGTARAAFAVGGVRSLYTINLTTGAATLVGTIGNGTIPIAGLTSVSSTLAVVGTAGDDTLVINATSANDGSYSLNGGAAVPFTNVTSFSFLGGTGDDTLTINNPAASVFAPSNGVIFNGQTHGAAGDTLVVQGGAGATFSSTLTNGATAGGGTLVTTNNVTTQTVTLIAAESVSELTTGESLTVKSGTANDVLSVLPGFIAGSGAVRETADMLSGTLNVTFINKTSLILEAGLENDTITYNVPGNVTGLTSVVFNMDSGQDTVQFLALAAGVSANVQLANGVPDRVVIGGTFDAFNTGTGNLGQIQGSINVDDSGGVGELYIDNSADNTGRVLSQSATANVPFFNAAGFTLNPTFLSGFFRYTNNIETFKYAAGSGADTFTINAPNDANINEFQGNGGNDTLTLNDFASMSNNKYVISGTAITKNDGTFMDIGSVDVLSLTTGTGNDDIDARQSPIGVTINAGLGDDTIRGSAFLDNINGGVDGFDTYIATGAAGSVIVTDDGITSVTFGNDVFVRNAAVPSIERVMITGDAGVNQIDATNFSGLAILAGNGGKDTVVGADVKIVAGATTFTDVDGDLVTFKITKAGLSADALDLIPDGAGLALRTVDLSDPKYKGAAVTLTSKRTAAGGDGFTNVGYLNATGNDLTVVKIDGDLGRVDAGNNDPNDPNSAKKLGLASLIVHSFGELGLNTQDPDDASNVSNVKNLGVLAVKTNFAGANLRVEGKIGVIKIGGDLDNAFVTVTGVNAPATAALAVALKSVTVGGNVRNSSILAGYANEVSFANQNVQIGAVAVKGNWIASNLVAGIKPSDAFFGNDDDMRSGAPDAIAAKIAKVVIRGQAYGTYGGTDHYGIVAETIGSASIGKAKLKFVAATLENYAFGPTPDFRIREI